MKIQDFDYFNTPQATEQAKSAPKAYLEDFDIDVQHVVVGDDIPVYQLSGETCTLPCKTIEISKIICTFTTTIF